MLHVTNGDEAVEAIRSTGVGGEFLVWRDVLHEGPVPTSAGSEELRQIRAGFLARCGWGERTEILQRFAARDERLLRALRRREELVFWFEEDLYDQLQALQALATLQGSGGSQRAVLVPVTEPIALSSSADLVQAYARAAPLTEAMRELAARAWKAFRAEDPRGLAELAAQPSAVLPALGPALSRLLEQFPGATDGLSRSERSALDALGEGPLTFTQLFECVQEGEETPFLGDVVFRWYLGQLATGPAPLVRTRPTDDVFELTDRGRRVRDGEEDRLAAGAFDRWIGGVRLLSPRRVWRWDSSARRLVPPT